MKKLFPVLSVLFSLVLISCGNNGTGPEETPAHTVSVSVTPSDGGSVSPGTDQTFEEGETAEFEATANEEYVFAGWTGDTESSDNPLSLTVDQDYVLTANFEIKNYKLTVDTVGEGAVSEQIVEQKSTDYDHGTVVELTVNPAEGWSFVEWQGDLVGTDNPAQITVDEPKEVTAKFEQVSFYLAENGVTIICSDAEVGDEGTVDGTTYIKRSKDQITVSNAATTCTSDITDMSFLFQDASSFNEDISHWDVSSVTTVNLMFDGANNFDGDISYWDVSSVTNVAGMFREAYSFNQDISSWDVSNVTDTNIMFANATSFNQDIDGWDVSSITYMRSMFYNAEAFNQDLGSWDVSSVDDMEHMFRGATVFNGDISSWDISSVTDMKHMFRNAASFNQDISNWDVSNATEMEAMFLNATAFNQDLSGWCVTEIESEPTDFSTGAGFESDSPKMPVWGTCPS